MDLDLFSHSMPDDDGSKKSLQKNKAEVAQGQTEKQPLSVHQLTLRIRDLLEKKVGNIWLAGELSNFKAHTSGHLYFTLIDESAQIRGVMFRGDAGRLKFKPKDGDEILIYGQVTVYMPRGEYQIRVLKMIPQGRGSLQEQFEELKHKLSKEGLFDSKRKKKLPLFPGKVGVITSPSGAAVRDFLRILGRRCPRISVQIFGVHVQGVEASREIIQAIEEFNRRDEVDVIVLTRGGGSYEDLWSFNEEKVVRAIDVSRIPVVSAVGHEVDFTMSDFVADVRAATPSAAAEIISEPDDYWQERLNQFKVHSYRVAISSMNLLKSRWENLSGHYVFHEPRRAIEQWSLKLDDTQEKMEKSLLLGLHNKRDSFTSLRSRLLRTVPWQKINQKKEKVETLYSKLKVLSPQATLERGYTLIFNERGNLKKNKVEVADETRLVVKFADGDLKVQTMDS